MNSSLAFDRRSGIIATSAVLAIYAGQFGVIGTDQTGLGINSELIIINQIMRITGVILGTIAIIALAIAHQGKLFLKKKLVGIFLLTHVYLIGALPFASEDVDLLKYAEVAFRSSEWIIIVTILSFYFEGLLRWKDANFDRGMILVRRILIYTFFIVVIHLILFQDSIVSFGLERTRLGGSAIHPNRLALLATFGILVFGMYSKRLLTTVAALFICYSLIYAAQSRIGYVTASVATLVVILSQFKLSDRRLILTIYGIVSIPVSLILFDIVFSGVSSGVFDDGYLTLNNRTRVWDVAIELFYESPIIGHGFIVGPTKIGEYLGDSYWYATNAQNDLASAAVSGGLALILLYFYMIVWIVRHGLRVGDSRQKLFYLGVFGSYLISSWFEPLFMHSLTQPAVAAVIFMWMLDGSSKNINLPGNRRQISVMLPTSGLRSAAEWH